MSAQPAREWFHRQKDNEGRTVLSSSPASATQVKVFLRIFFKDYCYYFRQIFCGFVNIVKPLREFGEKETISVAGTV